MKTQEVEKSHTERVNVISFLSKAWITHRFEVLL